MHSVIQSYLTLCRPLLDPDTDGMIAICTEHVAVGSGVLQPPSPTRQ